MLTGKTHLTGMNAQTKVSAKGQVVIPKDVRDRYAFAIGNVLDVVERPDGVLLRRRGSESTETFEAITARIRARVNYDGPPLSTNEMGEAVAEMWARGGPDWDK